MHHFVSKAMESHQVSCESLAEVHFMQMSGDMMQHVSYVSDLR